MQSDQEMQPDYLNTAIEKTNGRINEDHYVETIARLSADLERTIQDSEYKRKELETVFINHYRVINTCLQRNAELVDDIIHGYQEQLDLKEAEIISITGSIRYRIGDKFVETAKNPLKVFYWPVWALRLLRSRLGKT
jgi:hypothetical protein